MSDWDHGRSGTEEFHSGDYGSHESGSSSRWRERAQEGMEQVRSSASDVTYRARRGVDSLFDRHPLTFGLGALALGVAAGMLLPGTRQEERWMGDASTHLRERAGETVRGLGEVAKATWEEARETAMREMEGHGVDPAHLKESVKGAAKEVREAAEHTVENARKAAEEEADRQNLR